jgi:hypothetical protein
VNKLTTVKGISKEIVIKEVYKLVHELHELVHEFHELHELIIKFLTYIR